MSDGKIYITISDKRGEGGGGVSPSPSPAPSPSVPSSSSQKESNLWDSYLKYRMFSFLEQQAQQAINYSIQNIGNFTGDFQTQRNVEKAVSNFNLGKSVVMAGVAGASVGGPVGAVAGMTLAIASQGINLAYQEYSGRFANKKMNRSIDMLRQQSGMDVLTNGSR